MSRVSLWRGSMRLGSAWLGQPRTFSEFLGTCQETNPSNPNRRTIYRKVSASQVRREAELRQGLSAAGLSSPTPSHVRPDRTPITALQLVKTPSDAEGARDHSTEALLVSIQLLLVKEQQSGCKNAPIQRVKFSKRLQAQLPALGSLLHGTHRTGLLSYITFFERYLDLSNAGRVKLVRGTILYLQGVLQDLTPASADCAREGSKSLGLGRPVEGTIQQLGVSRSQSPNSETSILAERRLSNQLAGSTNRGGEEGRLSKSVPFGGAGANKDGRPQLSEPQGAAQARMPDKLRPVVSNRSGSGVRLSMSIHGRPTPFHGDGQVQPGPEKQFPTSARRAVAHAQSTASDKASSSVDPKADSRVDPGGFSGAHSRLQPGARSEEAQPDLLGLAGSRDVAKEASASKGNWSRPCRSFLDTARLALSSSLSRAGSSREHIKSSLKPDRGTSAGLKQSSADLLAEGAVAIDLRGAQLGMLAVSTPMNVQVKQGGMLTSSERRVLTPSGADAIINLSGVGEVGTSSEESADSEPGGQRSEEWFQQRKFRLTASAFSNALGFWNGGRVELWEEKIGRGKSFQGNAATQWGTSHEAKAVQVYRAMTGNQVEHRSFQVYRPGDDAHAWLGASPDGLLEPPDSEACRGGGVLEVKCPHNRGQPLRATPYSRVPPYYMPQAQGLLEIFDRDWLDFYVWTVTGSVVFRVERDRGYWELMYKMLSEFWWHNVVPAKHALREGNLELVKIRQPTEAHALTTIIKAESERLTAASPVIWREKHGSFTRLGR